MLPGEPEHPLKGLLSRLGLAEVLVLGVWVVLGVEILALIVLGVEPLIRIVRGVEPLVRIVRGVEPLVEIVRGDETLVRIVRGVETLDLDLLRDIPDPPDLPEFLNPPARTMPTRSKMRRVANFILLTKHQTLK